MPILLLLSEFLRPDATRKWQARHHNGRDDTGRHNGEVVLDKHMIQADKLGNNQAKWQGYNREIGGDYRRLP